MRLFYRKTKIVITNVFLKYNMNFGNPQMVFHHMTKAHKPKIKFEFNSCGKK